MFGFADRLGFRAIIYKCVEGKVTDRIVTAIDAAELALEGWSLSPAKAHPEEAMRDNMEYVQQCDMINTDRMRMINLPMITQKEALRETDTITFPSGLPLTQEVIFEARKQVLQTFLAESIEEYIAQLVQATRNAGAYSPELAQWIQYGASPRASLAFNRCSRALAWLDSRDYVSPEDIQQLAHEILRHRVLLTYRGEMDGVDTDRVVDELLLLVPVP